MQPVSVQATKSTRADGKSYVSYLARESFRTPSGPRSRTVCNISGLPPQTRELIATSLKGQSAVSAEHIQLETALDYGGLAVLNDAWSRFWLDELLAGIGTARQRGLLQAIIYNRLLFPCAKLSLAQQAAYDPAKLRGKKLVPCRHQSRRYLSDPSGVRTMCAYWLLREQVIKPLLAGAGHRLGRPPKSWPHWINITCGSAREWRPPLKSSACPGKSARTQRQLVGTYFGVSG